MVLCSRLRGSCRLPASNAARSSAAACDGCGGARMLRMMLGSCCICTAHDGQLESTMLHQAQLRTLKYYAACRRLNGHVRAYELNTT
jgi:hypothetical protein